MMDAWMDGWMDGRVGKRMHACYIFGIVRNLVEGYDVWA